MSNTNSKEFRIKEYVWVFEKSLNYMTGAIFSMFIASLIYISSNPDGNLALKEIFQIIDNDPTELLCILIAIISTLPYYFYYTLKDNPSWNACGGQKDNEGLLKICILYETGVFSFFYLILQGNVQFSLTKLFISIINIVFILIYLILLFIKNKSENRIGYFIAIIILALFFFILLSINSFHKLSANPISQNYISLLLLILFLCNTGINIFFLTQWESSEAVGIISNRIKIMIPIISMVIYTFSIIYCYFIFANNYLPMIIIALWIISYEMFISLLKARFIKSKIPACIASFVIFIFGIPIILAIAEEDKVLAYDLSLKWLILIGISIYIAAIKYWGYILKFLFIDKEQTKAKIMSVMTWFRNSILGSMLFISLVLIFSERYYLSLIFIIVCSLIAEYFIAKYVFSDHTDYIENANKIYIIGRIIEFWAIILPLIAFAAENRTNFVLVSYLNFNGRLPVRCSPLLIAFLFIFVVTIYVERKWNPNKNCTEKQLNQLSLDIVQLLKAISKYWKKIKRILSHSLPDKNKKSFIFIFLTWAIYILLTAGVIYILKNNILGLFISGIIIVFDWFFLSKRLFDHYINKMKEGSYMIDFKKIFEKIWKNYYLNTLNMFDEAKAKQFTIGDRLRPLMFFLGSSYGRYEKLKENDYADISKAACSLELIHKSSVMFDDFIDQDSMRRGVPTFHKQYNDPNKMILLGNAMLAQAQINFIECRSTFKCSDNAMLKNIMQLTELIKNLCEGCYKELCRANYDKQNLEETNSIIYLETVSLIKH